MADSRQMSGCGRFLTAFLGRVEPPPNKRPAVALLKQSAAKNFSETLRDREIFSELAKSDAKSVFSNFVDELQLSSDAEKVLAGRSGQFVLQGDGLSFVLLQATGDDKKLLNQLIKLPEILSSEQCVSGCPTRRSTGRTNCRARLVQCASLSLRSSRCRKPSTFS